MLSIRGTDVGTVSSGLNCVSTFAGAGGLDLALCRTGCIRRLYSTDSNPVFLNTVVSNAPHHHREVEYFHQVARAEELNADAIKETLGTQQIDLIMGGPPCDDFTTFGRKAGFRGQKAPLVFEFARLVHTLQPRAFVFENVPNLASMAREGFEEFLNQLKVSGFQSQHAILPAWGFGAPTLRSRLFVIGFREDRDLSNFRGFPDRTHRKPVDTTDMFESLLPPAQTVSEALKGLPDVGTLEGTGFHNHTGRNHRPETVEKMRAVEQGRSTSASFRYRPHLAGLSRSLTAGLDDSTKSYIHPVYPREMSVREYARLHGFPDSWIFSGTHHNGIKQVANAVPIKLGYAILARVVASLMDICTSELDEH